MPSITKNQNKNGFSFKITVSCGYDEAYRKKRHYKVWKAPEGWSEQRAEREAQRIAFEFEKAIKQGYQPDNRKTFAEYAAYVIDLKEHTGTKHSTIQLYLHLCERILPAIGHIKLTELRPNHLNKLYISLQEDCTKHTLDNARAKVDLGALIKERKWSRAKVARLAHLNGVTITTACREQVIRKTSADAIAAALKLPTARLFDIIHNTDHLAVKTVLQHHRFISTVLSQAEKEMLVPYNAASRATLPRAKKKPINYFQPKDIQRIIQALESEPLKWKTITHLFIVTGARRGEIMGLKWLYGDNVFEKRGIRRDRTGGSGKGRYLQGKTGILKRDGPASASVSLKMFEREGVDVVGVLFFAPRAAESPQEPRAASGACDIGKPPKA